MKDRVTGEWIIATDEEIQKIINQMPGKWQLATRMLALYGMRISELLALTPQNILYENGEPILVFACVKAGCAKGKKGKPIIRRQAIPKSIRKELLAHIANTQPDQRLFPCHRVYFWQIMRRAAYRANVNPKVAHPHSFRHNRGRAWANVPGINLFQLQQQIGHRGLSTLHAYMTLAASVEDSKKFLER